MPAGKTKRPTRRELKKDSAKRRLAEAERIYDAPDREEILEANEDLKNEQEPKTPVEHGDVVVDVNVRKPI